MSRDTDAVTYPQVGEQMKQRRSALKLSMRAAAKLGGVSPTAWSDLEAGKSPASLSTQTAVARALRWPLDWLDQIEQGATVTPPEGADQLARLQGQVDELVATVIDLAVQVKAQGVELARLARRSDPPAAEA